MHRPVHGAASSMWGMSAPRFGCWVHGVVAVMPCKCGMGGHKVLQRSFL